jgi:hypothetical protein
LLDFVAARVDVGDAGGLFAGGIRVDAQQVAQRAQLEGRLPGERGVHRGERIGLGTLCADMAGAKAAARAFEQSVSRCDERPVLGSLDYRSDDWVGSNSAGLVRVVSGLAALREGLAKNGLLDRHSAQWMSSLTDMCTGFLDRMSP